MGTRDPRVDAYIANAAAFARPVLTHLRRTVHSGCPDVTETIKWGMPHFEYRGILCHMAAFKRHCAFGFWKGSRVIAATARAEEAMGQFGRITSRGSLPSQRTLVALVRKAARLNAAGVKSPIRLRKRRRGPPRVPADLRAALARNARARATFLALPPSGRREYTDWLAAAKRAETRARRLAQTMAWLSAGKPRNWQYGA